MTATYRLICDPHGRARVPTDGADLIELFDDGNGRLARIMVNAELSAAGQVRVVIPTSFRDNYLAASARS